MSEQIMVIAPSWLPGRRCSLTIPFDLVRLAFTPLAGRPRILHNRSGPGPNSGLDTVIEESLRQ